MNHRFMKFACMLIILSTCNTGPPGELIPTAFFDDIIVYLNLPKYMSLQQDKGFVEMNDQSAGVRGIILYRHSRDIYFAYERNCSYKPNAACATVNVHSSGLFMIDTCCGSTFDFVTGLPTGGPAWRPLIKYQTYLQGSKLVIQDQVVK